MRVKAFFKMMTLILLISGLLNVSGHAKSNMLEATPAYELNTSTFELVLMGYFVSCDGVLLVRMP